MIEAPPVGFPWATFFQALGAIVTIAGIIGGALVAFFYGRKVNVQVAGEIRTAPGGDLILAARPSIQAVGFRGIRVSGDDDWADALVQVTEVWLVNGHLDDGLVWDSDAVFGADVVVAGGETLTTTVLVDLGPPPPLGVIGWRVAFLGTARRPWGLGGWAWEDKAFVPVPVPQAAIGP